MTRPTQPNVLGPLFRWVLDQRGWTQWRLAEEAGVDPSWVTRAVRGERDSGFSKVMGALHQAGYKLFLVRDPESGDGGNVYRRRFLVGLGAVVGSSQLGVAVPLAYGAGDLRDPEEIAAAAQRYVAIEREYGGRMVYTPAARGAQTLLRRAQSERLSIAYLQAVGWYIHEVAWLAYDAGQRRATTVYGAAALDLADKTRDHQLEARACNLLSLAATSAGDSSAGAALAQRGLDAACEGAPQERTLLWARLARAKAARGPDQVEAAMHALAQADKTAVADRDIYEATANRGIILSQTGAADEARRYLAEAADIIKLMGEPRNQLLYVARSAKVALDEEAYDESAALVGQVLDDVDIVSARVDKHLREWMSQTASRSIANVKDITAMRERVRDHLAPFV